MSDIEFAGTHESSETSKTTSAYGTGRLLDGVAVSRRVAAESFADVTDVLRAASGSGEVVIPWGGGTMMGLGNIPAQADVALDLTQLNAVVVYEPDDLTIAVQAGCRIGDLNRLLAEHGQMLPFDAANPSEATVGGLYSTAVSGPRRFGHGSMRDLVIGITTVSPDGEISRGGGMVVKNVSGYDMMRLHYGALGSLGVVLQLNFKVLPAPRALRTVVVQFPALDAAVTAAMSVRESVLGPTAIALLDEPSALQANLEPAPWSLLLRAEGPEMSVGRQAERLTDAAGVGALDRTTMNDEASAQVWQAVNRALAADPAGSDLRVRVGVAPSLVGDVIQELLRAGSEQNVSPVVTADLGNGLVFARSGVGDARSGTSREFWERARALGAHATLLAGPVDVKAGTDVFGNQSAGFQVMRALKHQFDPAGILNRGRFIGHL